ncbi:MAG: M23 family metallopeptidase, partial [Candidatus Paceibacterota bacterium]
GISRYITPEFRQNYIKTLNYISKEKDFKNVISDRERAPVVQVNIPKDLSKNHQDAIDLFIDEKSPISPMASGLVVLAENGWNKENDLSTSSAKGGNTVIIFNPINKSFYRYEHMQDVFIKTGEVVDTNVVIGTVGHTGLNASIPGHGGHLHLEVNTYSSEHNHMKPTDVYVLEKRLVKGNDLLAQK